MIIDIIDLTDPKYSKLSPVQLAMVRTAQAKKNKILAEAEEDIAELYKILIANHFTRSTEFKKYKGNVNKKAEYDIEVVKEDLIMQLSYEALGSEGNETGPYRYPENPNYNLSYSQRFLVVRNYYMGATDDPNARLAAFSMDTLARTYLGEFYQTLYDLLASYC